MTAPSITNKHLGTSPHLGWKPTPPDRLAKIIRMKNYAAPMRAGVLPASVDYVSAAQKSLATMLRNNALGCCTISAVGHQSGIFSANRASPKELVMTDAEVNSQYPQICGRGDQGCYIPDVLDWWRDKGIQIGGVKSKIAGYALVDPTDYDLIRRCQYLFGALHCGFMLTQKQYQDAAPGAVWTADTTPIVGGHSIPLCDYTTSRLRISTWAMVLEAEYAVFAASRAQSEIYVVLADQWADTNGLAAHGINVEALKAALATVAAGGTPVIPDGPTPTPPPPTPGGGGTLSLSGSLDFLGTRMPIQLSGILPAAAVAVASGTVSWLTIVIDCSAIISAFAARDWPAVAVAVAKLLADLGINLTPAEVAEALVELRKEAETYPLLMPGPPCASTPSE